jgi:hypothetical protein
MKERNMTIESVPPVKTNTAALLGMIAGIIAVIFLIAGCCVVPLAGQSMAVVFGLAAIIFGAIGSKKIKASEGAEGGKGMATAAIIMGIASLVIGAIVLILVLLVTVGLIASPAFLEGFGGLGGYY